MIRVKGITLAGAFAFISLMALSGHGAGEVLTILASNGQSSDNFGLGIDTYENLPNNEVEKNDKEICFKHGNVRILYSDIFSDVREAMGYVHSQGYPIPLLKQKTLENLQKYLAKDKKLPQLLQRLRDGGKKIFLATNSEYI